MNDSYGHAAGDLVIREFAAIVKANTRASNMCGRIGGEEFVLVLTHIDHAGVQIAIERVRQQLERKTFTFGPQTLNVTASFGVSGVHGRPSADLNQLLKDADRALYAAKRGGRNRTEFAAHLEQPRQAVSCTSVSDARGKTSGAGIP